MKATLLKIITFSSLCTLSSGAFAALCTYTIDNEWNSGFIATISITNDTDEAISGWSVNWQYNDGTTLAASWNADISGTTPYTATNLAWNSVISVGQSVSFGLQGVKAVNDVDAAAVEVTGTVCSDSTDENTAPIADFIASASDLTVLFDASSSYDADLDSLTYTWDFDDGNTATTTSSTYSYEYDAAGSYDVTLSVSDGQETSSVTQTVDLTIDGENEAPVANATYSIYDVSLSVDASASTDPNGDDLTYSWDFGDGTTGTGETASHTYATGGSYTVTLTVSDAEFSDTTSFSVTATTPVAGEGHVTNPFLGATSYINPDYASLIETSILEVTDEELIRKMEAVKSVPTAVWLDRIDAITGGEVNSGRLSLEEHLLAALDQKEDDTPITVSLVIYNLPDRDCAALASNGTLSADEGGLQIYQEDYIDVIADLVSQSRFNDLRIIATIEPDSLPNLVTNQSDPACAAVIQSGVYVDGITYALSRFSEIDNVYTYLDIAHSGWLGWESNMEGAITLYTDLVAGVADGDMSVVDGFVTNVSNYTPVEETFLTDPYYDFDGDYIGVYSTDFYEWNPVFDEVDFTAAIHAAFVANGFPEDVGMIVDTSRNGWGGTDRPSAANDAAATEEDYVADSKIDRRSHRGLWCNVSDAGIGERPQVLPQGTDSVIEAYVWIKPPGESDGTSDDTQTTPDEEGKSFDPMCSPDFTTAGGVLTDALDNAPSAGSWFHDQFIMLIENAYPEL